MKVSERDQIIGLINGVEAKINGPEGNEEWLHIDQVVQHAWDGDSETEGMAATFTNQYHDHLHELDLLPVFEHDDGSISHGDGEITAEEMQLAREYMMDMYHQQEGSDTCHQECESRECHDHCHDVWSQERPDDNDNHEQNHHDVCIQHFTEAHCNCHASCQDDEACHQTCPLE